LIPQGIVEYSSKKFAKYKNRIIKVGLRIVIMAKINKKKFKELLLQLEK